VMTSSEAVHQQQRPASRSQMSCDLGALGWTRAPGF
jgi:hypothetical protein